MNYKKELLIGVTFLAITGCATDILKTRDGELPLDTANIGAIYYLPNALIPVTVKFQDATPKGGEDNQGSGSTSDKDKTNPSKKNAEKENENKPIKQYVVTIGANKYIPDMNKAYRLEYNPSIATDDTVSISIGPNQLLQTSTFTSTDKSGEVVAMLGQIAGEVAKMALMDRDTKEISGVTYPSKTKERKDKDQYVCETPLINLESFISPSQQPDNFSTHLLNKKLKDASVPIEFEIQPMKSDSNDTKKENPAECKENENSNCYRTGILLRSPIPYILTVKIGHNIGSGTDQIDESNFYKSFDKEKHKGRATVLDSKACLPQKISQDYLIMAPNNGPVYALDMSRSGLVKKKTDLTIMDGMLTKIDVDKPSQLVGLVKIPLDIAKAIAGIPGEILQVKIKSAQDQAAINKSQYEIINSQLEMFKKQQELKQLQEKVTTTP